jgi:glycosyltransferase involved in cell wall biosynthesis
VAIPAFNEERSVVAIVTEVLAHGSPALVIDDGSTDRTADMAERAGVQELLLPVNLGVGAALRSDPYHRRAPPAWAVPRRQAVGFW